MKASQKLKSSSSSKVGAQQFMNVGSQQVVPYSSLVRVTYIDANGVEQEFESDVFATSELAAAAKDGIRAILKASGAQNIRVRIIKAN